MPQSGLAFDGQVRHMARLKDGRIVIAKNNDALQLIELKK
jgi:hypothetical protein